ncbi:MAG: cation transporter [Chitinophagales bacterium]|nr:cation transporter [Chitinophagales bacterium]
MGHHHHHQSSDSNLKFAFFVNLIFTVIEIVGGVLTNSVSILSDALHDFGDSLSLGLAWYFQKVSTRGRDGKFSYGYKRFSLLGAIINGIVLLMGSIIILYEAIPRIFNPEVANAKGMILLAILGIVMNGAAAIRVKKGSSVNEQMVSVHLMEDVLGWVAVLIGAIVMYYFDLPIIDPILSLLIVAFVLYNVVRSMRKTLKIVLQGVPSEVVETEVQDYLLSLSEVDSVHDLHIWSLDGEYNVLTVHLVANNIDREHFYPLKLKIRSHLNEMGIAHATIEFERSDEACIHVEC